MEENTNKAAAQIQMEMNLIMGISNDIVERQESMLQGIEESVSLAGETVNILDTLSTIAHDNMKEVSVALERIDNQLKDSETIKSDMIQVVEDTKKAVDGSAKNIELVKQLISNLKH